jgi:uracil-DNA glycosylase family 4
MSALKLVEQAIRSCTRCPLAQSRTHAVPGWGPPDAPAMLVAEKPGWKEDQRGLPMIGPTGELFDTLLGEVGLSRRDFYITNVVKCMPPKKTPLALEWIEACEPWLRDQIRLLRPRELVLCGNAAIARWFPGERIGLIHGKPRRTWEFMVMPTYHPAAVLNADDPGVRKRLRAELVKDLRAVKGLLEAA